MQKPGIIIVLLTILSVELGAQQSSPVPANQLPVDPITKLITYEGVVESNGTKADVLYKRAFNWFKTFYKNPTEVIRENDSLKFTIVGKPRFRINNPPDKKGIKTDAGLVQYTITVSAKDGRFKYEITAFNWKQSSYFACERWMDTKSKTYSTDFADYLNQVDLYIKDLVNKLKNDLLNAKPVKDKDNW